jgi:hypothetical protein
MRHAAYCRVTGAIALTSLLGACAGQVSKQDAATFDAYLTQGNYSAAAQYAHNAGQIAPDGTSKNLIWSLQDGAALTYAGNTAHVIPVLDGAEALMQKRDLQTVGDGQYAYATYDGVMANTYKALDFLAQGDRANARVEFNRVEDRQRRAKDDFAKEQAAFASHTQASAASNNKIDFTKAIRSVQSSKEYQDAERDLQNYGGYIPFINPLPTYLAAIFRIANSTSNDDLDKAAGALREVRGMVGPNALLDSDLALTARNASRTPRTWIVYESGESPTFAEYRVIFPVPVVGKSNYMSTVTVALPRMVFHRPASTGLHVTDSAGTNATTQSIGSFDRVMASEFQQRLPGIMTRAVGEAAVKVAMQEAAGQTNNSLLKLATAVAANISTADTRSWTALPSTFAAARMAPPADGKLHLVTDTGTDLGDVTVPSGQSAIVYVKLFAPGGRPAIRVYPL